MIKRMSENNQEFEYKGVYIPFFLARGWVQIHSDNTAAFSTFISLCKRFSLAVPVVKLCPGTHCDSIINAFLGAARFLDDWLWGEVFTNASILLINPLIAFHRELCTAPVATKIFVSCHCVIVPTAFTSVFFRLGGQLDPFNAFPRRNTEICTHRVLAKVDLNRIKRFRNAFFIVFIHKISPNKPTCRSDVTLPLS